MIFKLVGPLYLTVMRHHRASAVQRVRPQWQIIVILPMNIAETTDPTCPWGHPFKSVTPFKSPVQSARAHALGGAKDLEVSAGGHVGDGRAP